MGYQHFYYAPESDSHYQPRIGDKIRVKRQVPLYGGRVGKIIDLSYGVHVEFQDKSTCVFDSDDVEKHERE